MGREDRDKKKEYIVFLLQQKDHPEQAFSSTSSDDPKNIKRAREMGAVDYIKKPADKEDL